MMTKDEAIDFFAALYRGEHHIPTEVREYGTGWEVRHYGDLATWDFDALTRLVLLAHDRCVRVEVTPCNMQYLRIAIWQRHTRLGGIAERHPTIETALACWRERYPLETKP